VGGQAERALGQALSMADPVLVQCSQPPDFLLVVSLWRVRYRHRKLRSTQLVDTALDDIADVRLERLLPWLSWGAGIAVFLAGIAYFVISVIGGDTLRLDMLIPMGFGFGLAVLVGPRLRLSWTQGGQRHVVTQPGTLNRSVRSSVAQSIREAYALLKDPAARQRAAEGVAAEHKEAVAVLRESTATDERRLCPDGSCVGLLDDTGRCKLCGKTLN
jgi:hypothetical protein